VNLRFFAVCVLDRIIFALHIHQGVFGQRLPSVGFASMSDIGSAAATIPAQKPSATIVNIDSIRFFMAPIR